MEPSSGQEGLLESWLNQRERACGSSLWQLLGHKADVPKASPDVRFWTDCVAKLPLRRLAIRDSVGGEDISGSSA